MNSNKKPSIKKYVEEDEGYWENHLSAFKSSGLTRVNYCKQHQVNYDRFGYWKKRLLSKSQPKDEPWVKPSKLVPIAIKAEKLTSDKSLCSLHLRNGHVLQIHDEGVLSLLLAKVV